MQRFKKNHVKLKEIIKRNMFFPCKQFYKVELEKMFNSQVFFFLFLLEKSLNQP